MVLVLNRTYFPKGTNGVLVCDGEFVCHTIELPWLQNTVRVSCIPEGKYFIKMRYSKKYRWHLEVLAVKGRSAILFHPANDAQRELQGCIAPVMRLSGVGQGLESRRAFDKLKRLVYQATVRHESVLLIIQKS
ncbi:MAG: DUF5675 family protein [Bacteroidia bacterium]